MSSRRATAAVGGKGGKGVKGNTGGVDGRFCLWNHFTLQIPLLIHFFCHF